LTLLKAAREDADAVRAELGALQGEIEQKVEDQRDDIARLEAEISRQVALRVEREERLAAVRAERDRQEAADRAAREQADKEAAEKAAAEEAAAEEAAHEQQEAERKQRKAATSKAAIAVETALAQVGKPYRWAGSGPNSFDCSGLTSYAWRAAGVSLPHNSGMQHNATTRVAKSDLQPGDLLFFYSPISHVGMYIGDGKMVEAPYTGKNVRVRSIELGGFVGAGRPRY
jgi:cell wall-associated NlpC family hydrolase